MIIEISDYDALPSCVGALRRCDRIALDTEAASFHRYSAKTCLVQISTAAADFVIDTLAVADLTALIPELTRPTLEVVLHDADSDLRVLSRDFGVTVAKVYDTRVAAQLAGEPAIGLGALLDKYCHITVDKRYQRADWSMRPLPPELVDYAVADTRHLAQLRDALDARLAALGRRAWAEEEFAILPKTRWESTTEPEAQYLRLKGFAALSPPSQGAAMAVHRWRDDLARALDRAPFRILGNDQIVNIARAMPRTVAELRVIPGLGASVVARFGSDLLRAVQEGARQEAPKIPRGTGRRQARMDPLVQGRFLRLKGLRAARATALGLDPGVLCPNSILAGLAAAPRLERNEIDGLTDLRRWQREALGGDAALRGAWAG